jgi:hypothetical protein
MNMESATGFGTMCRTFLSCLGFAASFIMTYISAMIACDVAGRTKGIFVPVTGVTATWARAT